jgi:hypothetical protein
MKRLIKNTLIFTLSLVLLILVFPLNRRLLFQELTDDCSNRSIWINDRIFNNDKPIDIAFLGSSHTINGVNDKLIEEKLKTNIANIGYCRLGENLIYILLKEMLKTKNVKTIIIEVREDEDRYSHPIFPYIAETKDVLLANPLYNRDLFSDYYRHIYYRLEVIKNYIFGNLKKNQINKENYGFSSSADTASLDLLNRIKEKQNIRKPKSSRFERDFYMKFSRTYLEKINKICKKQNIKIFFLYLPSYESKTQIPLEFFTYIKYGKILFPPKRIYSKTTNWYDDNHLNQTGANELSNWLASELQK